MRRVTFDWKERIVLTPVEIVGGLKKMAPVFVVLALLDLIRHHRITAHLGLDFLPFVVAVLVGGAVVPLLLPLVPFRAFALKGALAGAIAVAALLLLLPMGRIEAAGIALLVLAIASYMAMMFTGSTTFTTLAGAELEVRYALPLILISAATGAVLRAAAALV
jgi:acetyl-CoA decarbonylase/synthase complex subunit gamma